MRSPTSRRWSGTSVVEAWDEIPGRWLHRRDAAPGVLHTPGMSIPTPPPAEPGPPAPPAPVVPYGGAVTPVDPTSVSAPITAQGVAKGVGQAAVSWGARAIIFFVIRAIFRALFRR